MYQSWKDYVEKQLRTVVIKDWRYTYLFVSHKYLTYFIFYLAGGKTFQPTFVKQATTSFTHWQKCSPTFKLSLKLHLQQQSKYTVAQVHTTQRPTARDVMQVHTTHGQHWSIKRFGLCYCVIQVVSITTPRCFTRSVIFSLA